MIVCQEPWQLEKCLVSIYRERFDMIMLHPVDLLPKSIDSCYFNIYLLLTSFINFNIS